MAVELYDHQKKAIKFLKSGSILKGGVGSGKTLTSLAYFFENECGGIITINGEEEIFEVQRPRDLYIITTSKKRDDLEWDSECSLYGLYQDEELSTLPIKVKIDSWNNIHKYTEVKNAFFIFDEQRAVGYGLWGKSLIEIAKKNKWLMLTATPGDVWMDYMVVFIANGFYKHKTDFINQHVIYKSYVKYPAVDRYIDTAKLMMYRKRIVVHMDYLKKTSSVTRNIFCEYDKDLFNKIYKDRWNIFEDKPIKNAIELSIACRRLVNTSPDRIEKFSKLLDILPKAIVFYNFNYELDILRKIMKDKNLTYAEWNGQKHQKIPDTDMWVYLVQYTAGAEGWNCITTNVTIFYSLNHSYKITKQAEGRIDRMNTPFEELRYFYFKSKSRVDFMISRALEEKRNFQEREL